MGAASGSYEAAWLLRSELDYTDLTSLPPQKGPRVFANHCDDLRVYVIGHLCDWSMYITYVSNRMLVINNYLSILI